MNITKVNLLHIIVGVIIGIIVTIIGLKLKMISANYWVNVPIGSILGGGLASCSAKRIKLILFYAFLGAIFGVIKVLVRDLTDNHIGVLATIFYWLILGGTLGYVASEINLRKSIYQQKKTIGKI